MAYRIALVASRSHRRGPDSRLIRFVREFEHFLEDQQLCAPRSTAYALLRAGLLHRGSIERLPSGRDGGIVHVTRRVVNGELDVVVYLMDPRDPTSVYPETNALKRECVAKGKFFLSTYMSAVEWASLVWEPGDDRTLESYVGRANNPAQQRIALIAHDERKIKMLKFALIDHLSLISKFKERVGTGTTASYLSGKKPLERLRHEIDERLAAARKAGNDKRSRALREERAVLEKIHNEKLRVSVTPMQSGPDGGDVEIAYEVLAGNIDKVVFFEDPYTARPHEHDIQLLERTCRACGERVVCLSDPESATKWAEAWKWGQGYRDRVPVTPLRALEDRYAPLRVVVVPTNPRNENMTTVNICEGAAYYLSSLIERQWLDRTPPREPIRVVVPWGSTMGAVVEKLGNVEQYVRRLVSEGYEPPPQARVQAMSLTGLLGTDEPLVEANVIAERLADIYPGSDSVGIPGSAFVKESSTSPQHVRERVETLQTADLVVLVGAPIRETFGVLANAPIWPDIVEDARARGAVGELSGLFVDVKGQPVALSSHRRVGMSVDDMAQVAARRDGRVVLLIGSREEYVPLAKALLAENQRRRFISTLVTDHRFALMLLADAGDGPDAVREHAAPGATQKERRKGAHPAAHQAPRSKRRGRGPATK